MFDIDGTLVQSYEFDEQCYVKAVREVTETEIDTNWENYPNVSDRGILKTFLENQNLSYSLSELEELVKPVFIENIKGVLRQEPAEEVKGAKEFVSYLMNDGNYKISLATGGWYETAKLKLDSAGFNVDDLVIASSNDHFSRVEIMKLARLKIDREQNFPVTYFGDALWDVKACEELGFNLVIVGDRAEHTQQILDFLSINDVLAYVG